MSATAATTSARNAARRRSASAGRPASGREVAAPRAPRRVSGPARARPRLAPRKSHAALPARALDWFRALPDHPLLDRLVRGRAWIPVLGVMLAGIVTTQVEVLKLGADMGTLMSRSAALQNRNQTLQDSVAALQSDQRIERLAAQMGMVMAPPTAIDFLAAGAGTGTGAGLQAVHAPDPTQFEASLPATATLTAQTGQTTGTATTGTTGAAVAGSTAASGAATTTTAPAGGVNSSATSGTSASAGTPATAATPATTAGTASPQSPPTGAAGLPTGAQAAAGTSGAQSPSGTGTSSSPGG